MRVISIFIAPGLSIPMSPEIFPNAYFMGFPVMPAKPEKPIFLACKVIKIIKVINSSKTKNSGYW